MAGMMTGLLLLLLVGVTVGRVVDLQKRIIGGKTCVPTDRLYHVKLVRGDETEDFECGGTLIHKDWILTAGHCADQAWTVKAVLGVHPGGSKTKTVKIKDVQKYTDGKLTHDIALLKLTKSATGFPTATLPDCSKPLKKGDTVQIAGHGATEKTLKGSKLVYGPDSPTLQCAETYMIQQCPAPRCTSEYAYHFDPKEMLCFEKALVDITGGDSGGGVMFSNMIYGVQVGSLEEACTGPIFVMDVCKYKKWIEGVTGLIFP